MAYSVFVIIAANHLADNIHDSWPYLARFSANDAFAIFAINARLIRADVGGAN